MSLFRTEFLIGSTAMLTGQREYMTAQSLSCIPDRAARYRSFMTDLVLAPKDDFSRYPSTPNKSRTVFAHDLNDLPTAF